MVVFTKKFIATALVFCLCILTLSTSVFAAYRPSIDTDAQVVGVTATVKVGDKTVDLSAELHVIPASKVPGNKDLTDAEEKEFFDAVEALKNSPKNTNAVREMFLKGPLSAKEEVKKAVKVNGAKIQLKVQGLKPGVKYQVLQCGEGCDPNDISTWLVIDCIVDAKTGLLTFVTYDVSPSPIAIVSTGGSGDSDEENPEGGFSGVIENSSEAIGWGVAGIVILLGAFILILIAKRRNQEER